MGLPQTLSTVFTPTTAQRDPDSAQPGHHAGEPRVSLAVTDSTIGYAIQEIARQAKLRAIYNKSDAVLNRRITVRVTNQPVLNAMAVVLRGTGLGARMTPDGEAVMVGEVAQQPARGREQGGGVVVGQVTDSTTEAALNGAQVRVEGMPKLTTVTTDSGRFTLRNVPPGDQVLQVRLFGYRPATRTVTVVNNERTTVRIALAPVPTVLSGVVTTATGTQQKMEVGNDITTLNVDSLQRVAPITSVTDLLESRVPGLTVQHTSGVPGAPSRIRLRGVGSVTRNNDPIVIVNGIRVYAEQSDPRNTTLGHSQDPAIAGRLLTYAAPSPLDQIDPNSIETIEVLKGPSASAMYGSDAGNGVIVITLKRGRTGPTHWALTLNQGLSFQPGNYPVGLYRFGHYFNAPERYCDLYDTQCTVDSVVAFQALNDPQFAVTTGHGSTQQVGTTVSGGVGGLVYAVSGTYANYTGQLKLPAIEAERFTKFHGFTPPTWMQRPDQYTTAGGTSRLDLPLGTAGGRQGMLSLTSSLFKSDQQQSSLQAAIGILQGTYVDLTQLGAQPTLPQYYERATNGSLDFTNALSLQWPLASWLPMTATGGVNVFNTTQQTLTPRDYAPGTDSMGAFGVNRGNTAQYTMNVNTTIPSRWVRTAAGFNYTNRAINDLTSNVVGLPIGVNSPTALASSIAGVGTGTSSQASTASSTYGWFLAPTVSLHSRLFITPGLRLDGGSASGGRVSTRIAGIPLPGLSGFPKMDVSWLALDPSSEKQGSAPGWRSIVSMLRVRGAIGTAGRQPSPADQLRLFSPQVTPMLGTIPGQDILTIANLGNTKLRPERSREAEYGFDTELWRNRLSLSVSKAEKMTYDAIVPFQIAPSVLSTTIQQNIGVIRNRSLEVTADAQLLESRAVAWHVGATMSQASNLVMRLNAGQQPIQTNLFSGGQIVTRIVPGFPINGSWVRPILGYADGNQDGIIQPSEVLVGDSLVYVGQPEPTYQLNIHTDVALLQGRLTLSTSVAYQNGVTQFNQVPTNSFVLNHQPNVSASDPLLGNNPSASFAQQAAVAAFNNGFGTPYGLIQVVNTLRWQDLSLNYTAPAALAQLVRARQLVIALQASNLGLHTNYRGKDPNVNAFSSGENVMDTGQIPLPRTVNLKFILGN